MKERYYQSGCSNLEPQPQRAGYLKRLVLWLRGKLEKSSP